MKKKNTSSKTIKQKTNTNSVENDKLCAVLSYLVIGIIWYFADEKMKKSEFVKFHVKQGLVLLITDIIFSVIATIPVIGWVIGWILWIIIVVLFIIGLVNAINGDMKELPIIGKFAKKFTF